MPDSLLISGSEIDRHLTDWLGDDGTFLIRHNAPVETVLRYASLEEAQEALAAVDTQDEEALSGPFVVAECRENFLARVDTNTQVRFTQWLELAVEVEPFQLSFHDGLAARLQLLHLDNYVPCTWNTTTINIQIHVTRERMDDVLNGTLQLQAGSGSQNYETAQFDLDFDVGVWDQYIFHTFQFRPLLGPCRLTGYLGDTMLDSMDLEIVDDMPAVQVATTDPTETSAAEIGELESAPEEAEEDLS